MSELNQHRTSSPGERKVDYDAWSISEVEKGLAAADRGDSTDHHNIRAMIDSRYPAKAP